jgi:ABC-type molybdate transport system substrate-binding protein
MKTSQNPTVAQAFLDFLRSAEAQAVLTGVGFSIPE